MGGAATDAHFEVTLKSKKIFFWQFVWETYTSMLLKYLHNVYILKGKSCYILIEKALDKWIIKKAKVHIDSSNNPNDTQSC